MSEPISVDLPHRLGAAEAKRRIAGQCRQPRRPFAGRRAGPSAWEGDRLKLDVAALGQEVDAALDVQESLVRVTVLLPPALAFFGKAIEAACARPAARCSRTGREASGGGGAAAGRCAISDWIAAALAVDDQGRTYCRACSL